MSAKEKNKVTDYSSIEAKLEEEAEYDSLWDEMQTGFGPKDIWYAPEETYTDRYYCPKGQTSIFGNERKNQERSYTSSLRSRQVSSNPVNDRRQKSQYPRYRCRR